MTQIKKPTQNLDDLLAEFTDRVMDGKTVPLASKSTDETLRDLEETILRLHRNLPSAVPDGAKLKHMQADFKARVRRDDVLSGSSWQSRRSRQRWTLAFITLVTLTAIFIAIPFMPSTGGNVQGTAGLQPQGILTALTVAGGLAALIIWLKNRQ